MTPKIKEADVHQTLDKLVGDGLSPEFIRQCHEWWHLKAEIFSEVYEVGGYVQSTGSTLTDWDDCDTRPIRQEAPQICSGNYVNIMGGNEYDLIDPKAGTEVKPQLFNDGKKTQKPSFKSPHTTTFLRSKYLEDVDEDEWVMAATRVPPGRFECDFGREAQPADSLLHNFSFPDFVDWYSHFFCEKKRELKLPALIIEAVKKLEYALRGVAPQDPTIYPLLEKPLEVTCRTTRSEGGELRLVEARLPENQNIKIVVKKIPPVWEELFEQELKTHKTLLALGYEREVTNPIAHQQEGRILTYGYLAGDLSSLCTQSEEVKQRELWKAVELLLPLSLDLTSYFGREKADFFGRSNRKPLLHNHVTEVETVWELVKDKIQLDNYLTQSFLKNFFFRTALAKDGHHLREVDASLLEKARQVLTDEADLVTEEEWLRRITNFKFTTPFKSTKPYHSENNFRDYPSLLKAVTSTKAKALFQHYQQTIAPALAALPLYVGHDDFTIKNILATDIGTDSKGNLLYSGLKMHDVGLVMAPFQSYLYDLLVSSQAASETCEELLQRTYRALLRGCEQRGRAVPVQNTYADFREGYRWVAVDKHLRQASIKFMIQNLEEIAVEKERRLDELLYPKLKPKSLVEK